MTNESFPDELKIAVVVPIFQKTDLNDKTNYQPISLLPLISNIFQNVPQEQIEKFAEKIVSVKLYGFRKGYSTQNGPN